LKAKIFGCKTEDSFSKDYFSLKKGVPQGSIIGPFCCNVVLDGLEKHLNSIFPKNTRFDSDPNTVKYTLKIHNKTKISKLNDRTIKPCVKIETIRFADDILIIAKMDSKQIFKVILALKNFLGQRGLSLKIPNNNE